MSTKKSLYEDTLDSLVRNKERRLAGDIIAIPWNLPRLAKVLPGIEPEKMVLVSSGPKAGKTQITNFLYVFQPIDYLFEHPESNLDLKIFYFSLEISKEAFMRQAISYRLFSKYKITISQQKLQSSFNDYILDDRIEQLIKKESEWFEFLESKLDIIDNIRNPTAIFKYMEGWLNQNGVWTYKNLTFEGKDHSVRDKYFPNNPNLIVMGLVDHVSLLNSEGGLDQRQTIGRFSSEYCLKLRDKYKCLMVLVQQQALASEQQQFTNSGKSILEKLKPSPDGLANNKEVSRDVNLMIGLFNPSKFGFSTYKQSGISSGYDLDRLRDNHRELLILLNRDGISNAAIDLYFNGASAYFAELPKPDEISEIDYIEIEKLRSSAI